MVAQPTQKHMTCLASAALVLILLGVCLAPVAFAALTTNTIDPVAIVTDYGRHIILTGPIACTEGERAYLRVTVTQRATRAVAEGRSLITCTGNTQPWEVHASAQGEESLQEGPATAVALARISTGGDNTAGGDNTDAHQWLVEISLVGE